MVAVLYSGLSVHSIVKTLFQPAIHLGSGLYSP
jgi:hypothetical protein